MGRRPDMFARIFIYRVLVECRGDTAVLYVGQSRRPEARFRTHLSRSCHSEVLRRRIAGDLAVGFSLRLEIVEECRDAWSARERERWWINDALRSGHAIANKENPARTAQLEEAF